jgi:CBS domain-containing protein
MTQYRISSIMHTDDPTVSPDTPIRNAVAILVQANAAAAAVVDADGKLAGILTQKDCFRPALNASYYREWKGCVADHMTRDVITVNADDDAIHVAEMFLSHPHRVFLVLEGPKMVGVIHRSDVLGLLSRMG